MHPAPVYLPEVERIKVVGEAAAFDRDLGGAGFHARADEAAVRLAVGADAAGALTTAPAARTKAKGKNR